MLTSNRHDGWGVSTGVNVIREGVAMRAGSSPRWGVAVTCAAAVLLAGCGQQEPPPEQTSPPAAGTTTSEPETDGGEGSPTATEPAPTTTDGTATSPPTATGGATEPVEPTEPVEDFLDPAEVATSEQSGTPDLVVTGVRTGAHEGYDRVVLDLEGSGTVGWRVGYEDQPTLDGSGAPVDLAGQHTLVVIASGMRTPEPGEDLYNPGQLLVPGSGLSVVTEVLRVAPFEGQLNVYIGARAEAAYRVFALQDPARLVIDVAVP